MKNKSVFKKSVAFFLTVIFTAGSVVPANAVGPLPLSGGGTGLAPTVQAPSLVGIRVYADQPFRFDFIVDKGDLEKVQKSKGQDVKRLENREAGSEGASTPFDLKVESTRLIKYFLTALTIPEKDLWVNLSPEEKDRIVPEAFGQTEMGQVLLSQDHLLKQIASSALNPDESLGKKFWDEVYRQAQEKFGTTDIPFDTRNRVWIVPHEVTVFETPQAGQGTASAMVVKAQLKVMLENDYVAQVKRGETAGSSSDQQEFTRQIMRSVIIPAIEKEVNEGAGFGRLRQVYHAFILASWYKKRIRAAMEAAGFIDQRKVQGINAPNNGEVKRTYEKYLESFRKGSFDFIREEQDALSGEILPRHYFSGGIVFESAMNVTRDKAAVPVFADGRLAVIRSGVEPYGGLSNKNRQGVRLALFPDMPVADTAVVAAHPDLGQVVDVSALELSSSQKALLAQEIADLEKTEFLTGEAFGNPQDWVRVLNGPSDFLVLINEQGVLVGFAYSRYISFLSQHKLFRLVSRSDQLRGKGTFLMDVTLSRIYRQGGTRLMWASFDEKADRFYQDYISKGEKKGLLQDMGSLGREFSVMIMDDALLQLRTEDSQIKDGGISDPAMSAYERRASFEGRFGGFIQNTFRLTGKDFKEFTSSDWARFGDQFLLTVLFSPDSLLSEERGGIFVQTVRRFLSKENIPSLDEAIGLSVEGLTAFFQRVHSSVATLDMEDKRLAFLAGYAEPKVVMRAFHFGAGEQKAILELSGINALIQSQDTGSFDDLIKEKHFGEIVNPVLLKDERAISSVCNKLRINPWGIIQTSMANLLTEHGLRWWRPQALEAVQESFIEGVALLLAAASIVQREGIDVEEYLGRGIDQVVLKGVWQDTPVALKVMMLPPDVAEEEITRDADLRQRLGKYDFFVDELRPAVVQRLGEGTLLIRVVEFVEGLPLSQRMSFGSAEPGSFSADMALVGKVLDLLRSLVREGLEDADISGSMGNIFVDDAGRLRQIDYGHVGPLQGDYRGVVALRLVQLLTGYTFDVLPAGSEEVLARQMERIYGGTAGTLAYRIMSAIGELNEGQIDLDAFAARWEQFVKDSEDAEKAMRAGTQVLPVLDEKAIWQAINQTRHKLPRFNAKEDLPEVIQKYFDPGVLTPDYRKGQVFLDGESVGEIILGGRVFRGGGGIYYKFSRKDAFSTAMLFNEAIALDRLEREGFHSGVPRLLAIGRTPQGLPWIKFQGLSGNSRSMDSFLGIRQADDIFEILLGVAAVLVEHHKKGLIHNDLKPSNILFEYSDPSGKIRFQPGDFGIGSREGQDVVAGSMYFDAPQDLASPVSDVYGFIRTAEVIFDQYAKVHPRYEERSGEAEKKMLKDFSSEYWSLAGSGDLDHLDMGQVMEMLARQRDELRHLRAQAEFAMSAGEIERLRFKDEKIWLLVNEAIGRQIKDGDEILEIGTGIEGVLTQRLADGVGKKKVSFWASDIDEVAAAGAQKILKGYSNVTVLRGDLFQPVPGKKFDKIIFNLPWYDEEREGKHNDPAFLDRGYALLNRFLEEAPAYLKPGGKVFPVFPQERSAVIWAAEDRGWDVLEHPQPRHANPDTEKRVKQHISVYELTVDGDLLKGGIDLGAGTMKMDTEAPFGEFRFSLNPEELKSYQDAPGVMPVIFTIDPLESLPRFLGMKESAESLVPA